MYKELFITLPTTADVSQIMDIIVLIINKIVNSLGKLASLNPNVPVPSYICFWILRRNGYGL